MKQTSVTKAVARGQNVGRAAMIKHYSDSIRERRDLTPREKRRAIQRYGESLGR